MLECGLPTNALAVDEFPDATTFFYRKGLLHNPTCDRVLETQQILTCAADKLAEIGEAVGPVVWNLTIPLNVAAPVGILEGPYTFPPQDAHSRFIVRDAALRVLAHVSWLDMLPVANSATGSTCTDLYSHAVHGPSLSDVPRLFGTAPGSQPNKSLPPLSPARAVSTTADVAELAQGRLEYKAHLLRAAARMIPDLVQDSVYADLAGGARKSAVAGDFSRGQQALWGNAADGYYNSLAHATRVLAQRWQVPASHLPPWQTSTPSTCSPSAMSQDALELTYGADLTARIGSLPVNTQGQSEAVTTLERAGVVFNDLLLSKHDPEQLKTWIVEQLLFAEAVDRGSNVAEFRVTPAGEQITRMFEDISDADFLFAARVMQQRYRVLTNAGATGWNPDATATENMPTSSLSPSNPAGMHVFRGPIPSGDLGVDALAKLGGLQAATQCTESYAGARAMGTDFSPDFAVQDVFAMGQALYGRLVALRELTKTAAPKAEQLAQAATAELRAWSGEGRIFAVGRTGISKRLSQIEVTTVGFEPSHFHAESVEEMSGRLALVWGKPFVAECAAGLRTACPQDLASYMAFPSTADVRSLRDDAGTVPVPNASDQLEEQPTARARRFYGADGTWGRFVFPIAGSGSRFRPGFSGSQTGEERLYVVLRTSPSSGGEGRVLGAISLRRSNRMTGLAVSTQQRVLLDATAGIDPRGLRLAGVVDKHTLGTPRTFCLPGVPHDIFVPLENELTSDGDTYESSWRSLLAQAKSAALRADELGDKMLDWGLQTELRREDANSKLADLCGSYGLVTDATFEHGQVNADAADGPLKDCMGGDVKNVVFLGPAPGDMPTDPALVTSYIKKNVLRCDDTSGITNRSGLCDKATLTWGELALPGLESFKPQVAECDEVETLAESLPTGLSAESLKSVSQAEWRSPDRLAWLASTMRFVERISDDASYRDWYVVWNHTTTIMSSTGWALDDPAANVPSPKVEEATIWPGCQLYGACPEGDSLQQNLAKVFGTGDVTDPLVISRDVGWRVQGVLWTLAAMGTGGTIPARLFSVQVPVARYGAAADSRLVPAVYGTGHVELLSGEYQLVVGPTMPDDVSNLLQSIKPYPSGFEHATSLNQPAWLRHFWSEVHTANQEVPTAYLNAPAHNAALELDDRQFVGSDLTTMGEHFRNLRCAGTLFMSPGGSAQGEGPEAGRALLGEIKTGKRDKKGYQRWSNVCTRPHAGKRGTLQLSLEGDGKAEIRFRDVILAGKCNEDSWRYGYSGELLSTGAPYPMDREWWHVWDGNECANHDQRNVAMTQSCLTQRVAEPTTRWGSYGDVCTWIGGYQPLGAFAMGPWDLRPDNCSQATRARMFVNSYPPASPCDAVGELVAALGLACQLQVAPPTTFAAAPPKVDSLDQLSALGSWLESAGAIYANQASRLYVENVPEAVLRDFQNLTPGTGNNAGKVGRARLELGKNLEAVRTHWRHVGETLSLIGTDIENARVSDELAEIEMDKENIHIAIQRMESLARVAEATAKALGSVSSENPGDAATANAIAVIEGARHAYVSLKLRDLQAKTGQQYEASQAKILNDLHATLLQRMGSLEDDMAGLRTAIASTKQAASELESLTTQVQQEAAVAAGASFYTDKDGNVVAIPVNSVLNRQFDTTRSRYRKALTEARYLAFLSRVAIEQRIGERLDAVSFPKSTGPIESPGLWADDVCHMTGIDFDKYKDAPPPSWDASGLAPMAGGLEFGPVPIHADLIKPQYRRNLLAYLKQEGVIDDLSKQYIGDYVQRLETFVTHYNTEYPAHDGDDATVLSLRDDLMVNRRLCTEPSPNLLYFSGDLGMSTAADDPAQPEGVVGWRLASCDYVTGKCLRVMGPEGTSLAPPVPGIGVSLLVEDPAELTYDPKGAPVSDDQKHLVQLRAVTQSVVVPAGSYVLSWWDRAFRPRPLLPGQGNGQGNGHGEVPVLTSRRGTMSVLVTDEAGDTLAAWQGTPDLVWSERRSLGLQVPQQGTISVSVSVSLPGESVATAALSGMQLESAAATTSAPSPYVENGATLTRMSQSCALTPEDVQGAFTYETNEQGRGYYELHVPVTIDTDRLEDPAYLSGKLAAGNFNYRHVNLALNLVGTGLVDCTGQPATCRNTNTVDYTLAHDAFSIRLRGVAGKLRLFNFGEASIHDGRALASEIQVEVPVTAEYAGLLQQDGVTKTEYMGRPVDGTYRLRIWDRPGLQWHRLKDVQLVLRYRYWSSIRKGPNEP